MQCGTGNHHQGGNCHQEQGKKGGCCGRGARLERRFMTKEEKIAGLEAYLEQLKLEAQAVEEHIAALRA